MSRITVYFAALLCATAVPAMAQEQTLASATIARSVEQTYHAFQVDKEAKVNFRAAPRYPENLRQSRVEGEVLVQFVVDENGKPQMDSFRVLRSTHASFTDAVRRSLAGTTYHPAQLDGRAVRQIVQQPFVFNIGR